MASHPIHPSCISRCGYPCKVGGKMAITTEQQQQIKLENHDGVYSYTIVDLVNKPVGGIHDK